MINYILLVAVLGICYVAWRDDTDNDDYLF